MMISFDCKVCIDFFGVLRRMGFLRTNREMRIPSPKGGCRSSLRTGASAALSSRFFGMSGFHSGEVHHLRGEQL